MRWFRSSLGLRPRELLQAKGYIWLYIPPLVLIRIQYSQSCWSFISSNQSIHNVILKLVFISRYDLTAVKTNRLFPSLTTLLARPWEAIAKVTALVSSWPTTGTQSPFQQAWFALHLGQQPPEQAAEKGAHWRDDNITPDLSILASGDLATLAPSSPRLGVGGKRQNRSRTPCNKHY